MIKIDDLFNYRLTKEVQDSLKDVINHIINNNMPEIKDIVKNMRYPFKNYSVQFLNTNSTDTAEVEIDEDGVFSVVVSYNMDRMYKFIMIPYVSKESNEVHMRVKAPILKSAGVLSSKKDKNMKNYFSMESRAIVNYVFYCLILTELRNLTYIEGSKNNKAKDKLIPVNENVYRVIDLGKHTTTKPVNTGDGGKHSYEYDVRGFWRTLKSGKEIWVAPHKRCKGRGPKQNSTLIDIINVDKAIEKEVVNK